MSKGQYAELIHLACHGVFHEREADKSGIILGDGFATVENIMRLEITAELVALSACETGAQDVLPGNELFGLARVLFYAGARSALLSSWPVETTSALKWMTSFYAGLVKVEDTLTFAEAHQKATLAIMETNPDPLIWAPFMLIGKGHTRLDITQHGRD